MKKTIEIDIPEGFVDAKYNTETGNVEFVKKQKRPETWKEFCEFYPVNEFERYIDIYSSVDEYGRHERDIEEDRNFCVNEKEAEAFLALMQLRQLRKAWVGDWEPVWNNETRKHVIRVRSGVLGIDCLRHTNYALSFPEKAMAEDFLSCFHDLLETAKILL